VLLCGSHAARTGILGKMVIKLIRVIRVTKIIRESQKNSVDSYQLS
jgi:hypothetical protein